MVDAARSVASRVEGVSGAGDDRVLILKRADGTVALVVDGAGGTGRGSEAAEKLVAHVRYESPAAEDLTACLARADALLAQSGDGGQAAAVLVHVGADEVRGASVGDCGAWRVDATGWDDLSAAQVRKPLLGSGTAVITGFSALGVVMLLLATDGLLKYAPTPRLLAALRSGEEVDAIAAQLLELVRLRSGKLQDDVGLVIMRLG